MMYVKEIMFLIFVLIECVVCAFFTILLYFLRSFMHLMFLLLLQQVKNPLFYAHINDCFYLSGV